MIHLRIKTIVLLLATWLLALPGPARAQDCQPPGFAVGQFHNGHVYGVGQQFSVAEPAFWIGFEIVFGQFTGRASGRVVWELRSDDTVLAHGTWRPQEMQANEVAVMPVLLPEGTYAITLRPTRWREPGHYNVLATCQDEYPKGTLIQLQMDGGKWAPWDEHDLIGRILFEDAADIVIAPRPDVLFVQPLGAARHSNRVQY